MKKKLFLLVACLFFLLPIFTPTASLADETAKTENDIVVLPAPSNDSDLYTRYKDNHFQLITKEAKSLTGIKATLLNISGGVKDFTWAGVMNTGKFNATMVSFLFSYDIDTAIKTPILNMTASLANGMLSIASTFGILAVMFIMIFKFLGEQNIKGAVRTFFMTMAIFAGLVFFSSSNRNNSFASKVVDIDNAVESTFVTVNPVFTESTQNVPTGNEGSPNGQLQDAGTMISAKIFRTNVYEPYLLNVYGTTNEETIRKKTIKYKNTDYERIGILLNNDSDSDTSEDLFDTVTKYESEELKNKTISYKNNWTLAMQNLFYLVLNLLQGLVYFVLCILRLILILLRWLLFPLMPILLVLALFNSSVNAFKNGGKAFVTIIGFKGLVALAMVFMASYMSLGYSMAATVDDPFTKIITIALYLITPLGVYFFRNVIGKLLMGNLSLSDIGNVMRHPYRTAGLMNRASREQAKLAKQRRKEMKKRYKKNNGDGKKDPPKYKLQSPKSAEQKRSDSRNEAPNQQTNDSMNQPKLDRDGEQKQNVGAVRRYKQEKPVKEPDSKKEAKAPRLSQLRKERSHERQQKEPNRVSKKLSQAHENSRYQDMKAKRDLPERKRVQKQAQERSEQRQQERMRVVSMARAPRREGQSVQAVKGEFQRNAGNMHKQAGQTYQPKQQVTAVRGQWRTANTTKTSGTKQRVGVPTRPVQKGTKPSVSVPVSKESTSPTVEVTKRTPPRKTIQKEPTRQATKGVKRRRV